MPPVEWCEGAFLSGGANLATSLESECCMESEDTYNTEDFFVMRFYVKEYLARNGSLATVMDDARRAKITMLISFFFAYLILFRLMLNKWIWIVGGAVAASCAFTALIWSCAAFKMKDKDVWHGNKCKPCEWVWESLPIEYMNVADWGGNVKGNDLTEAKDVLYEKRLLDYVSAAYPAALGFVVICAFVIGLAQA